MGISKIRVGLIGHSHAVCLLDALGDWRGMVGMSTADQDQRYGEAFRGWFDVDLNGRAFTLPVKETSFPAPTELVTCLLTGKSSGQLVTAANEGNLTRLQVAPLLETCAQQLRNIDLLVSVLYGNETVGVSLIDNHPMYDFALSDGNDMPPLAPPPCQPIDRLHIARWVAGFAESVISSVIALQKLLPTTRIVHVLPPPPLESPEKVARREVLEDLLAQYGFVRPSLRLKWSLAYRARVTAALAAQGIQALQAPSAALTREGFLREDLSEGLTHGNQRYGAMIWEALDHLVGTDQ